MGESYNGMKPAVRAGHTKRYEVTTLLSVGKLSRGRRK